jgi:hypothetical protein
MADIEITATVDIGDLQRLAKKLNVLPALKDGVEAAGIYTEGEMSEYPAMSAANLAGPYPKTWYVRGTGSFWALKNGGFHSSRTSQTLGRRWTSKPMDNGMGAIIGNNADYAKYVQDLNHQAPFHKQRGWKTAQEFVKTQSKHVRDIIADFIHARLEGQSKR